MWPGTGWLGRTVRQSTSKLRRFFSQWVTVPLLLLLLVLTRLPCNSVEGSSLANRPRSLSRSQEENTNTCWPWPDDLDIWIWPQDPFRSRLLKVYRQTLTDRQTDGRTDGQMQLKILLPRHIRACQNVLSRHSQTLQTRCCKWRYFTQSRTNACKHRSFYF